MSVLIRFELSKIIKSKLFIFFIILIIAVMAGYIMSEYRDVKAFRDNPGYQQEVMSWEERELNTIKFGTQSLNEDYWLTDLQRDQITRRIAIAQYRLDNNIPKDVYKNVWWFFNDRSFNTSSMVVLVMIIIISGLCIAGEYRGDTIRQVLLLPYNRWRILLSKIAACAVSGLILYGIVIVTGILSGFILHGTDRIDAQTVLYFRDTITTMKMSTYSIIIVLLKLVEILFYIIFSVFICVISRNAAISIVICSFTGVFSTVFGNFISEYYKFIRYLPFLNIDFRKFLDFGTVLWQSETGFNSIVYENITAVKSVSIYLISVILMLALSFMIFRKQDQ
ncbi:MAG: ABC transporter permease subunit [Oscillospiraceae bacterium]|nr:ABC transporter permease subunit [Oscillospiraceae bacterium]